MRLTRLTAVLIAAATLTACSSDSVTAPMRPDADPSLNRSTCRAGYMTASGKCTEESTTTETTSTETTTSDTCRAGYLTASGRCK